MQEQQAGAHPQGKINSDKGLGTGQSSPPWAHSLGQEVTESLQSGEELPPPRPPTLFLPACLIYLSVSQLLQDTAPPIHVLGSQSSESRGWSGAGSEVLFFVFA